MVEIVVGPNLVTLGTFVLSWHGFFSFIAVASAVYLVGRWAPSQGIDPDDIYSIAIWAILGGILGARFVHVIDNLDYYQGNPGQILAIWSGGIGLWGGIVGGFLGGAGYALLNKHPVGVIADLTAPAMLFVQAIGRLGDIVNGEHCARAWDFALGFVWTNPASDARICANGIDVSVQPVIAYEMFWNMLALLVIWRLRGKLKPAGMIWAVYLVFYAVGRFGITFLRQDKVWALGMQEAHYIALLILGISVVILLWKARFMSPEEAAAAVSARQQSSRGRGTRAERRRQERGQ
ncbi:MAG TPA: prolipoprotein diacylglyceryl transferase [SAR202 cluster bacterium]|jgi:phosphatidylglycerol:prolipoprotein diacylglycerol transferase|nr:prolipoprotein diacylglyceryl transferase [SAR202 cluster bacterium]MDP7414287.1 prolipoprotein diacylglyceryl transferase [SAR202 cluster bacterium]HJO82793.1 prolipoprotein diacylglyceryl transferase [SAR202 cluster bacterium]|tara:strand:- start:4827 stop:5702 length:876 start_codon:yes stop_codon:yes gene_type:complete